MKPMWQATVGGLAALALFLPAGGQTVGHTAGAPYRLWERVSCASPLTTGVTTTCTISEGVINGSSHRLSFTQPVVNQIASNVHIISVSATVGTIAVRGTNVLWRNFVVVPGRRVTATIRVAVSVPSTISGASVRLSDGISAQGMDVVTGRTFQVTFATLNTATRTAGARSSDPGHSAVGALPKTGGGAP